VTEWPPRMRTSKPRSHGERSKRGLRSEAPIVLGPCEGSDSFSEQFSVLSRLHSPSLASDRATCLFLEPMGYWAMRGSSAPSCPARLLACPVVSRPATGLGMAVDVLMPNHLSLVSPPHQRSDRTAPPPTPESESRGKKQLHKLYVHATGTPPS